MAIIPAVPEIASRTQAVATKSSKGDSTMAWELKMFHVSQEMGLRHADVCKGKKGTIEHKAAKWRASQGNIQESFHGLDFSGVWKADHVRQDGPLGAQSSIIYPRTRGANLANSVRVVTAFFSPTHLWDYRSSNFISFAFALLTHARVGLPKPLPQLRLCLSFSPTHAWDYLDDGRV